MSTSRYRGLIALNGALIVVLALVVLGGRAADAQAPRASRAHGQYTMVTAQVQGQTEAAIIVIDAANQEMAALRWDRSRRVLQPLGYRDLDADAQLRRRQGR